MDGTAQQSFSSSARDNGVKALGLLLLFAIALLSLRSAGITMYAIVCMVPIMGLLVYATFRHSLFLFGVLMVVNYFLMYASRCGWLFLPVSIHTELVELMILAVALTGSGNPRWSNMLNVMGAAVTIWVAFCVLEVLNDSCGIGINLGRWYTGARLMAFQLLYAFVICSIYLYSPKRLRLFIIMIALLSLFAVFWAWKQKNFGFNGYEKAFLVYAARTHFVNGIIRYFSVFSDAANFGINMASCSVMFIILAITSRLPRHRVFFAVTGALCLWAAFTSGTRTAIVCFIAGMMVYIFLAKSLKIAVPVIVVFGLFVFMLAFTNIGQGNSMIRRMRSAFNPEDASLGVRDANKEALSKYMNDAPWGIGIGLEQTDVPPFNKYKIVSQIPPDSEYVYIWVRTGAIGITVFLVTTAIAWLGACYIVFFRIRNPSLRGIGAAFVCAFASIQLGGYANQILMQFPNVLLFYGGLAIVYILPKMEDEYSDYEAQLIARHKERVRLRAEKKKSLPWHQ